MLSLQDFGDGGAFPEIPIAQYPLNMGKESKESSSNALAIQLDAEGKVKYDVIARQGHGKDKVSVFNSYSALFFFFKKLMVQMTVVFFL